MYYFVLVYHIQSQHNGLNIVFKKAKIKNWQKFKVYQYFSKAVCNEGTCSRRVTLRNSHLNDSLSTSWGDRRIFHLLCFAFRMWPSWRPLCSRCACSSCRAALWCCACRRTAPGNALRPSVSSPCASSAPRSRSTGSTSSSPPNPRYGVVTLVMFCVFDGFLMFKKYICYTFTAKEL